MRRLACRCVISSRFHAGVQHSQFGQHDRPIWHCALQRLSHLRLSQYSEVAITTFWVQRGVCGSIPASVQSKGKRGVALSSFGLPGLPLRGRPSGEPSSREGYQGSGRLRGGHGACWERRCRNDRNFVNRDFVKDAVKANTGAWLYAAVGFQMP